MASGMGPAGLSHIALLRRVTLRHAGATAKHRAREAPCQEMGYDFVALPIETGGHQSEEAEQFFDRLVKYAGSGDSSDEARFRHFAATSLIMMANQIGVAWTILANLPITRHSQPRPRPRPLLGYVPHTHLLFNSSTIAVLKKLDYKIQIPLFGPSRIVHVTDLELQFCFARLPIFAIMLLFLSSSTRSRCMPPIRAFCMISTAISAPPQCPSAGFT